MAELITLLKGSAGRYTLGLAGDGTALHLAGEIYKSSAGHDRFGWRADWHGD